MKARPTPPIVTIFYRLNVSDDWRDSHRDEMQYVGYFSYNGKLGWTVYHPELPRAKLGFIPGVLPDSNESSTKSIQPPRKRKAPKPDNPIASAWKPNITNNKAVAK